MKINIEKALVRENLRLSSDIFKLLIEIKKDIQHTPGQFYMVGVSHTRDPLLKRPLSIYSFMDNSIQFMYRIRGRGTRLLSEFKSGDYLEIIGPCGNGYPLPSDRESILICAGGLGGVSLNPLIKSLHRAGHELSVLYGVRTSSDILPIEYPSIIYITEDGSKGEKGIITDVLKNVLKKKSFHRYYACGPLPMLRAVKTMMSEKGISGYISLEERMACGFGACLGCSVMTRSGYRRVCVDGPVFPASEVLI